MTGLAKNSIVQPERGLWRNLSVAFLFALTLFAASAAPAAAQSGEMCSRFGQGALDGWGACSAYPNIGVTTDNAGSIGGTSDWYLKLTDQSGPSAACSSDRKYTGNWIQKLGGCGKFCYDVRIIDIPMTPNVVIYPSFTIFGPPGTSATFTPTIPATTDTGAYPGWHHICAPISDGATPPSNSDGAWSVSGGSWTSIITGVTSVLLRVDFTPQPSEVVGYDNICMTPGDCASKVKVCKIAGAGITPGSPFSFNVGSQTVTVPAGPAPAGTCMDVTDPSMLPGSSVSVTENIPGGDAVSNIAVNPATSIVGAPNLGAGSVTIRLDKPVTEVDFTNTKIPPPEPSGCYKDAKVDVKCNPDGTYTVTVSGVGSPGDVVSMGSSTSGVTVAPAQQPWAPTTTWTISGATPGQTVVLTPTDTKVGGGEKPDTDKCCSGEIKIVMPTCPKHAGDVVVEKKVINKTKASTSAINSLVFPIALSCTAPANRNVTFGLNNAGSHTESNVAYSSVCSVTEATATLPAPPAGACGDTGVAVWATPVITPSSATVNAPVTAFTVVNELDCKDKQSVIDLAIEKTGATTPVQEPFYVFDLKVTNVGAQISSASAIVVTETVPPNMTFNTIGGAGWTCIPPGGAAGTVIQCAYSGPPVATGQVLSPIHIDATATTGAPYPPVTNCASVGLAAGSGYVDANAANDKSCVTIKKPSVCPAPMTPGPVQGQCVCPAPASAGPVPNQCICPNGQNMTAAGFCEGPPPPACHPPMVSGPVPGQCVCPAGTVLSGKECVKHTSCEPPTSPNAAGVCACPSGALPVNGVCVGPPPPPPACHPPMVPGAVLGQCVCPAGSTRSGGECVKTPACRAPMVPDATGACACPSGMTSRNGKCVTPVVCRAPMIAGPAGRCVCPPGLLARRGACVPPPPPTVCTPPAQLNARGACQCPPNMVAVGKSCVLRAQPHPSRDQPGISPTDIMRVLPGLIPHEGRGTPDRGGPFNPGGGGRSGPTGGPTGGPGKM